MAWELQPCPSLGLGREDAPHECAVVAVNSLRASPTPGDSTRVPCPTRAGLSQAWVGDSHHCVLQNSAIPRNRDSPPPGNSSQGCSILRVPEYPRLICAHDSYSTIKHLHKGSDSLLLVRALGLLCGAKLQPIIPGLILQVLGSIPWFLSGFSPSLSMVEPRSGCSTVSTFSSVPHQHLDPAPAAGLLGMSPSPGDMGFLLSQASLPGLLAYKYLPAHTALAYF